MSVTAPATASPRPARATGPPTRLQRVAEDRDAHGGRQDRRHAERDSGAARGKQARDHGGYSMPGLVAVPARADSWRDA